MKLNLVTGILSPIAGLVSGYLERKQKIQQAKVEGEMLITKTRYASQAKQDEMIIEQRGDYDTLAQKQKRYTPADEIIMAFFQTIIIMCFLPWTQRYVAEGFRILKEDVPVWFVLLYVGICASTLGLRWLVEMFKPVFMRLGGMKPATEKTVTTDKETGQVRIQEGAPVNPQVNTAQPEKYDDLLKRYGIKE